MKVEILKPDDSSKRWQYAGVRLNSDYEYILTLSADELNTVATALHTHEASTLDEIESRRKASVLLNRLSVETT